MEQQVESSAQQSSLSEKRPILITVLCILALVFMLLAIGGFLMPATRDSIVEKYGLTYTIVNVSIALLGYIGLVGYWKMRKWGVYVYTVMTVLSIGHQLIAGNWNIPGHIVHILIAGVGFVNLKRMT